MLFALYLNRYLIKVLLFITLNISIDRKIDRQACTYDTFVLYNTHADGNFVKFQLLDRLSNLNGSRFRAAYHEKHFVPGRDIFSNIEHIMTKSQTALVVLSPGFLTSKWAMYELSQAVVREHQGPHFKVVFLPLQEVKTLGNLPENLRAFLRLGSTIKVYEKHYLKKLFYELTHCTKRECDHHLSMTVLLMNLIFLTVTLLVIHCIA